jgi:lipase chaperone LimK
MKTILTQTTEHKKQLMLKFDDQQAQLSQLKASRSWRAGQMLKSIYKRIFSNEQKASPQKVLDEP